MSDELEKRVEAIVKAEAGASARAIDELLLQGCHVLLNVPRGSSLKSRTFAFASALQAIQVIPDEGQRKLWQSICWFAWLLLHEMEDA